MSPPNACVTSRTRSPRRADRAHTTMGRYAHRDDAEKPHPACRDDQQEHRPQEPGPHRGQEAGQ
ncbi:hypothetical protein [Streptomyces sp. NBC_00388]|uniref:hypothetical protein n=1 Tax=Streptomyces sp. NBC_00388 TaxID=2975735 RepID=UPI002E1FD34D